MKKLGQILSMGGYGSRIWAADEASTYEPKA